MKRDGVRCLGESFGAGKAEQKSEQINTQIAYASRLQGVPDRPVTWH